EAHGWGWHVTMHPDDLGRVMDTWQTLPASGEPGEIEARWRRCDGAYRWFLFRAEPLRDALGHVVTWYGTDTDIDDLKQAEERLRQDEKELRRIIDAIAVQPCNAGLYLGELRGHSAFTPRLRIMRAREG